MISTYWNITLLCCFAACMLYVMRCDFKYKSLPVPALCCLLLLSFLHTPLCWQYSIGMTVCFAGFFVVLKFCAERILQKPALGFGDVFLFACVGLWVSPLYVPYYLIVLGLFGIFMAYLWRYLWDDIYFPFGFCIGLTLLVWIAGSTIMGA